MTTIEKRSGKLSRRALLVSATALAVQAAFGKSVQAANAPPDKFDFLSKNGNSNCTKQFLDSIATMPPGSRIQGSCCSPMERTRYVKQIEGLKKFQAIAGIPPDPYDIDAPLAAKLLPYYDLKLTPGEQKSYDYAMANSAEQGPCCCRCWHWKVYGGLGKLLIREHGFDGKQVTEVWDLSDGCGGAG